MVNCPRCGTGVADGPTTGSSLCEACKWATMSNQPITNLGLNLTPAYAPEASATPRPPAPAAPPAVAAAAPVHPRATVTSGNLAVALLLAAAAGILAAAAWYGLALVTNILWGGILIGVAVALAAVYGNGGRATRGVLVVSAAVTLGVQLLTFYLLLRHTVIGQTDGVVPLVLSWDQTRSMFTEIPTMAWWITLVWGLAGAVIAWARKAH